MSNFERMCNEYRENKRLIEELNKRNDRLKQEILDYMGDSEEFIEGCARVTNTTVTTERLNTQRLKQECPSVFIAFSKPSVSKRFMVR